MKHDRPVVLVIIDGIGIRQETEYNAVYHASTKTLDYLKKKYPFYSLDASGVAVGLPAGNIGNSEVGHLTIGAGRVILQPLTIINNAINNNSLETNPIITSSINAIKQNSNRIHIIGILSDGNIHGSTAHIHYFARIMQHHGVTTIIHPILDGRDSPPQSALTYLDHLASICTPPTCIIGSLHGRLYAMDRDNNWERTKKSYDCLTQDQPIKTAPWKTFIQQQYLNGVTDEFIPPTMLSSHGSVQPGDGILFTNIRADRIQQLARCFSAPKTIPFAIQAPLLSAIISATEYHPHNKTAVLFPQKPVTNSLKEILYRNNYRLVSIAETEKHAHVTYFFNGRRDTPFPNEKTILIPSLRKKQYSDTPEMSAAAITKQAITALQNHAYDFYLINYANADMVGHSGNFAATVAAVQCVDKQIEQLYQEVIVKQNGILYVTADHGNAEDMFDPINNQPRTAHTANPVPFYVVSNDCYQPIMPLHELADIAPALLTQLNLPIPEEMCR